MKVNKYQRVRNYPEALQYLYDCLPMFHRVGAAAYKADLGNTLALATILGNPERSFPSIHIAGTNGKGSVSHFTASILQEAGYKVGLFTSPHLVDFRERIRINGQMIPRQSVVKFINRYQSEFSSVGPSFFEWTFALASYYFAKNEVDIALMETGMGGRLDSTNVVEPLLTCITSISKDHTRFLGNTLKQIAAEKAGIIKPSVPVIVAGNPQEVAEVVQEKADSLHAPVDWADKQVNLLHFNLAAPDYHLQAGYSVRDSFVFHLEPGLHGIYQLDNLKTVLSIALRLPSVGFPVEVDDIKKGIKKIVANTHLHGRWEILGTSPLRVADIGHNEGAFQRLNQQLSYIRYKQLHVVLGLSDDKDLESIQPLLPKDAIYYFCKADVPRAMDAQQLAGALQAGIARYQVYGNVQQAWDSACAAAAPDDLVLATGSAFVIAEIISRKTA